MTVAFLDADAASILRLFPARPRVLALGEPTHGEDDLLDLRNELFRQLVEGEDYRTIAIESDCLRGLIVDDYVTTGAGDLDDVLERGFSHGFGACAGNRELVRWMRAYNEGRPAPEHLRFAGFDGPLEISGAASPRPALTALHAYLAADDASEIDRLLGADERWTNPAVMRDPSQSVGRTPEAGRLRLLADDLVARLDEQTPQLIAASSRDDWQRARLHGRTATGLLRYHASMADPSASRMARLCALRDSMMAANLLAISEQGPALVYAHNAHLQRDQSSMRMGAQELQWWSAGAIVSSHLGQNYAFLATAVGTIRHQGVDVPPPDTLEGCLYELPPEGSIEVPTAACARVSPWYGYAPLDPAHVAGTDGIIFVRDLRQR